MTERYPTVDPAELEPEYSEHLRALGEQKLHWQTDTFAATQLALRDREIARVKESNRRLGRAKELLAECESLEQLANERDAAQARVEELEEALRKILAVQMDLLCTYCGEQIHTVPVERFEGRKTYDEACDAIKAHDLICSKSPFLERIAALEAERDELAAKVREMTESPISMVLHCPKCGHQHIDAPDPAKGWTNPPHKSHLCHQCGAVWRPADVYTTGVSATNTMGSNDTHPFVDPPSRGPWRPKMDLSKVFPCVSCGEDLGGGVAGPGACPFCGAMRTAGGGR